MKKQIGIFIAILFAVSTLMVGCKAEVHTHTFEEEWSSDETSHWHASTCGHEVTEGKTTHTFGDWMTTKEPTEEAEGSREKSCTVCEYTVPEVIAKLEHTHKFASEWTSDETNHWKECRCGEKIESAEHEYEWTVTKEATCTEEGSKTGVCEVCKKEVTEKIDAKGHSFGIWTTTKEPTETEVGQMQSVCEVCKETVTTELQPIPKGCVFVKGTPLTGTESWTPSSEVFVSGRKLTIPDLLVSDHEVTRGEYTEVMGEDPSTASANDKDGNKLTGDDVLNNPVNCINWYDAIVYCNKLSMQENLTPCYTIKSSTDPDDWGEVPYSNDDPSLTTWDAATCDFEANGYRLPTEAEWEWLARGGENYTYAGSHTIDDVAWYRENTNSTGTREVKSKAPNGYGLYDMSGNVFEWCWDWRVSISDSTAADGASSGYTRVKRGGAWDSFNYHCEVSFRTNNYPFYHYDSGGFRVVRQAN